MYYNYNTSECQNVVSNVDVGWSEDKEEINVVLVYTVYVCVCVCYFTLGANYMQISHIYFLS